MKKLMVLLSVLFFTAAAYAQNTYKAIIKDAKTNSNLSGVTLKIQEINIGTNSDSNGQISLNNIPDGKQLIRFSFKGYQTRIDTLMFPLVQSAPAVILLQQEETDEELEEVIISATRSSRTIDKSLPVWKSSPEKNSMKRAI
jgi:outer membrane receptor for ferrienterochelin and colicins